MKKIQEHNLSKDKLLNLNIKQRNRLPTQI